MLQPLSIEYSNGSTPVVPLIPSVQITPLVPALAPTQTVLPIEEKLKTTLEKVFGYKEFRGDQLAIMKEIMEKRDVVAVMPTGFGKSLLYQLPAVCAPGVTIVVSPTIALMADQELFLRNKKIESASWNSAQGTEALTRLEYDMNGSSPKIKILFTTPESLQNEKLKSVITILKYRGLLNFFVLDESHLIVQWSSFRPDYLKLCVMRVQWPDIPIMALTASATDYVKKKTTEILKLKTPKIFQSSFNRKEIEYEIRYVKGMGLSREEDLKLFLKQHDGETGIIYSPTRAGVDELAAFLQAADFNVLGYHAGKQMSERTIVQNLWSSGTVKLLVATIAFGLGISKDDVRFVVHMRMPQSMETFYQESGRAGRDRKNALSIMYYSPDDCKTIKFLINKSMVEVNEEPGMTDVQKAEIREENKRRYIKYSLDMRNFECMRIFCETKCCRRKGILKYFGEIVQKDICNKTCDVCKGISFVKPNGYVQRQSNVIYSTPKKLGTITPVVLKKPEAKKIPPFNSRYTRNNPVPLFQKREEHLPQEKSLDDFLVVLEKTEAQKKRETELARPNKRPRQDPLPLFPSKKK